MMRSSLLSARQTPRKHPCSRLIRRRSRSRVHRGSSQGECPRFSDRMVLSLPWLTRQVPSTSNGFFAKPAATKRSSRRKAASSGCSTRRCVPPDATPRGKATPASGAMSTRSWGGCSRSIPTIANGFSTTRAPRWPRASPSAPRSGSGVRTISIADTSSARCRSATTRPSSNGSARRPTWKTAGRRPTSSATCAAGCWRSRTGPSGCCPRGRRPDARRAVLDLAERVLPGDAHAIWWLDVARSEWRIVHSRGLSEDYVSRTAPGDLLTFTSPLALEDLDRMEMLDGRRQAYMAEGIRSMLTVPLPIGGRRRATLVVYHRLAARDHGDRDTGRHGPGPDRGGGALERRSLRCAASGPPVGRTPGRPDGLSRRRVGAARIARV